MTDKALKLVDLKAKVNEIYPEHESKVHINIDDVREMARMGMDLPHIAALIGITVKDLKARMASSELLDNAIKQGAAKGIAAVSSQLYKAAMEGSLPAIMFFLKCKANWRDSEQKEKSNPLGDGKKQVRVYLPDNGRS